MNATARAIYAHRHTVAYRLERVRELTGLDPAATEDRERLGLGLKALRIVERDLPTVSRCRTVMTRSIIGRSRHGRGFAARPSPVGWPPATSKLDS